MRGNQLAVKTIPPEVRAQVEERLADGWPFKEIESTLGVSYHLLRKHWPGRQWTRERTAKHAAAVRRVKL